MDPARPAGASDAPTPAPPDPPDRWWQAFGDPDLELLVGEALEQNFDLAAFRSRLRSARAVIDREASVLLPALNYSGFAEESRTTDDFGAAANRFGAGIIGSYQVDVWRRNRSLVESAALEAEIAREQLTAAAISLSAEVAALWYALVEQLGQADLLDAQIASNEQVLRVVRARFGGGVVRASDVLRQERLLESTREQRAVVRADIQVLEHALLVLLGRTPTGALPVRRADLPPVPPRPATGLPADLMRRRPDVRSALFAVQAADADIAVAVAARYPSVTLALDASTVEEQVADLFDDWTSLIAIDVLGPLFDGGQREAEVQRTEAVKAERIADYGRTVLTAFRQVVDAVEQESARIEQIARLERQLDLAQRTSTRLNREYLNGDISYIDVLQAQTTEQRLQRDLLLARRLRIQDRIDLYSALAGGWPGAAELPMGADGGEPRSPDRRPEGETSP